MVNNTFYPVLILYPSALGKERGQPPLNDTTARYAMFLEKKILEEFDATLT